MKTKVPTKEFVLDKKLYHPDYIKISNKLQVFLS